MTPDECPVCDSHIDSDGDSLDYPDCVMPYWHSPDCDTCGATYCDQSC